MRGDVAPRAALGVAAHQVINAVESLRPLPAFDRPSKNGFVARGQFEESDQMSSESQSP